MKLKLFINSLVLKGESQFYKWIKINRRKIIFFGLFALSLYGLSSLPYINLFVNRSILFSIVLIILLGVFIKESKVLILIGSVILLVSYPLVLFKEYDIANQLGNFVFGVFFLAVLYKIFEKKS